jgi:hypothetical protein
LGDLDMYRYQTPAFVMEAPPRYISRNIDQGQQGCSKQLHQSLEAPL